MKKIGKRIIKFLLIIVTVYTKVTASGRFKQKANRLNTLAALTLPTSRLNTLAALTRPSLP